MRNPNPVNLYLRLEGSQEELVAMFYNERNGFSALENARIFAKARLPKCATSPQEVGWHWRIERQARTA